MADCLTTLLFWSLLTVRFSTGAETIPAKLGQNVILPCKTSDNRTVIAVEWSRTDLKPSYVLLYRNENIDQRLQHKLYHNRLDLNITQLKAGNATLVLKNVTFNDSGIYECIVAQEGTDSDIPICIFNLTVAPPPAPGDQGGDSRGLYGLIAVAVLAVIIAAAAAVVVPVFFMRMRKKKDSPSVCSDQEEKKRGSFLPSHPDDSSTLSDSLKPSSDDPEGLAV